MRSTSYAGVKDLEHPYITEEGIAAVLFPVRRSSLFHPFRPIEDVRVCFGGSPRGRAIPGRRRRKSTLAGTHKWSEEAGSSLLASENEGQHKAYSI
jgi:hypothetical protein